MGISYTFPHPVKTMMTRLWLCLTIALGGWSAPAWGDIKVDDLPDLTGGVVPIVQYKGRDPFSGRDLTSVSQIEYEVKVKNHTGDPLVVDSLILVIESLLEISGRDIAHRVEIKGYDGILADGKPFFRVPGPKKELPPFGESATITIRVNNPDFLRFYPPEIRVRGLRRSSRAAVKELVESLMKKGVLHPEEAAKALEGTGEGIP
jgi:hypothetical protein